MCDSTPGKTPRGKTQAEAIATAVTLDEYEVEWAKSVGYHRHQESERRGLKQSDGSQDQNALRNHRQGAAAELALTKFLNIPWNATVNTYNGFPDLDGYLECRSKQERQQYLRLHPKRDTDKGAAIFVSVTCMDAGLKTFRIDGWIMGSDAMQPKYLKSNHWGKTEWEPPLSDLQQPVTLKNELEDRLKVVNKGREKMREWVRATFQKEANRT